MRAGRGGGQAASSMAGGRGRALPSSAAHAAQPPHTTQQPPLPPSPPRTCTPGMTSALSCSSPRPCSRCTASTPTSPPRCSRHAPNSGCSEAAPAPSSATRYSVGLLKGGCGVRGEGGQEGGWSVWRGAAAASQPARWAGQRCRRLSGRAMGHRRQATSSQAGSRGSRRQRGSAPGAHLLRMRPAEPRSSCANSRMTDCIGGGGREREGERGGGGERRRVSRGRARHSSPQLPTCRQQAHPSLLAPCESRSERRQT